MTDRKVLENGDQWVSGLFGAPAAASGVTALSSPTAMEPASGLHPDGFQSAGAMLLEIAGSDYDYVSFRVHRAQGERPFFGVNLHRGYWAQSGNGPTLAAALTEALSHTAGYYPPEGEVA